MSETQRRVLNLLAGRRTNMQIAAELALSPETVKWNVSQILSKTGLRTRADAADWWRAEHRIATRRTNAARPATAPSTPILSTTFEAGRFAVSGRTLAIEEWRGSAPGELHVHHADDIAWHVLEASLRFRFAAGATEVTAGTTLFVPAGTPHTFGEGDDARYLVIAAPRLFVLFAELRSARSGRPHTDWGNGPDRGIYEKYDSELLD